MRFRFTLRDIFWLTLVVAISMTWLLNRQSWINRYGEYTITHAKDGTFLMDNRSGFAWLRRGDTWSTCGGWPKPYNPAWFNFFSNQRY